MATVEMTVEVQAIPPGGLDREWARDGLELRIDADVVAFTRPAEIVVHISRNGREVHVQGRVETHVQLACVRCVQMFERQETLPVDMVYMPHKPESAQWSARAEEDADVDLAWYDGQRFDLGPDVREIVMLSVPMAPVCAEDCRGLCIRCGANLNDGACGCPAEETASPFAVLSNLKAQLAADAGEQHEDT